MGLVWPANCGLLRREGLPETHYGHKDLWYCLTAETTPGKPTMAVPVQMLAVILAGLHLGAVNGKCPYRSSPVH